MNRKRFGKIVIVLFLLAALPVITAVMAQGQEPVGKVSSLAPDVVMSETQILSTVWESEPNNTMGQANVIDFDDVYGAELYPENEVDFYKFYAYHNTAIIVNTDANLDGKTTDTVVTLYDANGNQIGYNDDMGDSDGEYDSLIYHVLTSGWYYVKVTVYPDTGCSPNCDYELMVYSPLLISAAAAKLPVNANVEGIPFRSEDVLAFAKFSGGQHKWLMFLDGSDIGFTKPLNNLSTGWTCSNHDCPSLIVSYSANVSFTDYQGIARTAKPWDWIEFQLDRIGPNSIIRQDNNGHPLMELHVGAAHGLTTAAEKLDAIDVWSQDNSAGWYDAAVYISTTGAASVPKGGGGTLKTADEDLFVSEIQQGWGSWWNSMEFDGSPLQGMGVEDVFAADYVTTADVIYLTILGNGTIMGHPVTQKDIFSIYWNNTWNTWNGLNWHGPDWGWNYNIDAFDWPGS